ncbi:MAG: FliM/FliN family flagellar motor switch protein [bacterium]
MDLNDLLAEVEGIGGDQFIPQVKDKPKVKPVQKAEVIVDENNIQFAETLPMQTGVMPNIDAVLDVELEITVELGKCQIAIKDLLNDPVSCQLILDKSADDPLAIYANGHKIGYGEALVVDNRLAVRINKLSTGNGEYD